ncbi:MAG: hypothetical protein ACFE9D_08190 [Promethearchaeota archaeon]
MTNSSKKRWFTRFILLGALYDVALAVTFLFFSPIVSILLNYPISILSAALLQIIGAFLVGFGSALLLASRNLDQHLIIPITNIPARIIAAVVLVYYIFLGLPFALLVLGIIEGFFGVVYIIYIIAIPEYTVHSVFKKAPT